MNYDDMTREELIRELRLISLRRQVTPHFLFNSISVAVSLIAKNPKMAMTFLRHVAQMYRYLLRYGNEYHVPVEQEMEMLQQYYELMCIRHLDSIHLTISPQVRKLRKHPLPPLTMQGLLENAIKHNIHTAEKPLEVRIYTEDGMLCISNNMVPLLAPPESTHMGLRYMNETMRLLFNREIGICNDGSTFIVKIPLLK